MLKVAIAAAGLLFLAQTRATADELLTGEIRDTAGGPLAGAHVTGLNAAHQAIGADTVAADGTFALTTTATPVAIRVTCDYCQAVVQTVVPREPAVVVIERFNAVTANGPTPADLRALPYRHVSDIASLVPFSVVSGDRITDRGLDYIGALEIDGLPFYNALDGGTADPLVPAHAAARWSAAGPLAAPAYGGYATGGIFDVSLSDPNVASSRADAGDAADVVVRARTALGGALAAIAADSDADRAAVAADAALPFGGGRLAVNAVDLTDSLTHAAGAGIRYATDSPRATTAGSLSLTQTEASSLVALRAQVRMRGPLELTVGVRGIHATAAADPIAGVQNEAGLFAAVARGSGIGTLSATLALDSGSDAGVGAGMHATTLIGSLGDDLHLGSHWSAHLGAARNGRLPTFGEVSATPSGVAFDRSLLGETWLEYTDLHRLRVRATAYAQRTDGPAAGSVRGAGFDAAWQVAPRLSVRAWALGIDGRGARAETDAAAYAAPGATPAHRLFWLTYESGIRIDALVRSGALEGDVRLPINAYDALALGTTFGQGRRRTTLGLTLR